MFEKSAVIEYFDAIDKWREEGIERELSIERVKGKAVSIVGPRRAGKSFYLLRFVKNKSREVIYIDFDHLAFKNIRGEEIKKVIALYSSYYDVDAKKIILDEIQNIRDWERVVKSLLIEGYEVYVSGSSSRLLSKELSTLLRGRTIVHYLYPFSFSEFLKFNRFKESELISLSKKEKLLLLLEEYMKFGGYPEVVKERKEETKINILKQYFDELFYRDFVDRFRIKNLEAGKFLLEFIVRHSAKRISINKIAVNLKDLGIATSNKTLKEYLSNLSDTLNLFFLEKYSTKLINAKIGQKKAYVVDNGMLYLFFRENEKGVKIENLVFMNLLRKKSPLESLFYYLTKEGYEVDFLVKEGKEIKKLIQVTYANSYEEIPEREVRALLHAKEELNLKKAELIIITWDYEEERKVKWWGKEALIKFIPLWKFLLFYK